MRIYPVVDKGAEDQDGAPMVEDFVKVSERVLKALFFSPRMRAAA
jgi:hypothetical protein